MNKYNDLMQELNFLDSSVGIWPTNNITDVIEVLNEYNITPIETTTEHVLFSDSGQQYKLSNNGQWIIEKTFDINEIEKDALKILTDLDNDEKGISIFGQLIEGIKNYIRIEKNKKYNTYFIDMYIGNNRLEYNGEISEVNTSIREWFKTVSI